MNLTLVHRKNGRKSLNWKRFLAVVLFLHLAIVGTAEGLWMAVDGGFSPLVAGYALIAVWVVLIRIVGEALWGPEPFAPSPSGVP